MQLSSNIPIVVVASRHVGLPDQRRHDENVKIECAQRHFAAIGVDYSVTSSVEQMVTALGLVGKSR